MTLPDSSTGLGHTKSLSVGNAQVLVLENDEGQILDLSVPFEDQPVNIERRRLNTINNIPGRVEHHYAGGMDLPMAMAFFIPTYSLNHDDAHAAAQFIEQWFRESPGQRASRIYWVRDVTAGRLAYLPSCHWATFRHTIRTGKRLREVSGIEVLVQSTSTRWYSEPSDTVTTQLVQHGSSRYFSATNDGSVQEVVIRESDEQPLYALDDQGNLFTLGQIKSNRSIEQMQEFRVVL